MADSPEDEAALEADAKAYHADDLVKRLRSRRAYNAEYDLHGNKIIGGDPDEDCQNAADRIEALEAALRKIEMLHYDSEKNFHHDAMEAHNIARAALAGKKKDEP